MARKSKRNPDIDFEEVTYEWLDSWKNVDFYDGDPDEPDSTVFSVMGTCEAPFDRKAAEKAIIRVTKDILSKGLASAYKKQTLLFSGGVRKKHTWHGEIMVLFYALSGGQSFKVRDPQGAHSFEVTIQAKDPVDVEDLRRMKVALDYLDKHAGKIKAACKPPKKVTKKTEREMTKHKQNPTIRAKVKRAWDKAKKEWEAGYDPKWSGGPPVSFSHPIPYKYFFNTSYHGFGIGDYEKDPWGKTYDKLVRALGKPQSGDVDSDGIYQEENDFGQVLWDINQNVNFYYLQWDDGLVASINFRMFDDDPETLEGLWIIRTDSLDQSKEVLKRLRKLFRATAAKKKAKKTRKKVSKRFKKARGPLKKFKGKGVKKAKKPAKRKVAGSQVKKGSKGSTLKRAHR